MRKSDIGPFGVVTLVLVLLADVVAVGAIPGTAWTPMAVLTVAAATGRVAAVAAAREGVTSARTSGFGTLVAGTVSRAWVTGWTVGVLVFGGVVAALAAIPIGWMVLSQAAALVVAWALRVRAERQLGGVTGDVFGALIEVATAVTLVGIALW
jgi:adenosylcobinamide-GDP ribazoletransferase